MSKKIKTGSDFSGVGAFDQALKVLGIDYETKFACDMDKYARQTYIHNYGEPKYYPENVYNREIPNDSLDIYMTSPPCQAFSLAGKRLGKEDLRGVLFFNSHEFIQKNKPRFFIFENVKGLLSSKNGLTFNNSLYLCLYNFKKIKEWQSLNTQSNNLNLLNQTVCPYLFMNWSKKLGLRKTKSGTSFISNSELSFEKLEKIVGSGLKRRLMFLENRIYQITKKSNYYQTEKIVQFGCKEEDLALSQEKLYLIENLLPMVTNMLEQTVDISVNMSLFAKPLLEDNSKKGRLYTILMELNSTTDPKIFMYVLEMNIIRLIILALDLSLNLWKKIWHTLTGKQEFTGLGTFDEWLFNLDHLNYHIYWKVLNAKDFNIPQNRERVFIVGIRDDEDNVFRWPQEQPLTKRLRDVLESEVDEKYFLSENQVNSIIKSDFSQEKQRVQNGDYSGTLLSRDYKSPKCVKIKSAKKSGFEVATENDSIDLKSVNNKNRGTVVYKGASRTLDHNCNQAIFNGYRIRRLTPRECFRLMDFPESFTWTVSDSQAYKQAGNSICVGVLARIIKGLKKL